MRFKLKLFLLAFAITFAVVFGIAAAAYGLRNGNAPVCSCNAYGELARVY